MSPTSRFFAPFQEADLRTLQSVEEIRSMHPLRFEWFCKYFLSYLGYRSLFVTKKRGEHQADDGVDLSAEFLGERVLIQCKRWNRGIGGFLPVRVIRELGGCMARDGIGRGAVVAKLLPELCSSIRFPVSAPSRPGEEPQPRTR